MELSTREGLESWFRSQEPTYARLTRAVCAILESLLADKAIACLSVSGRTKKLHSFLQKIDRKGYDDPLAQIMDFAGIRVITYLDADARRVGQIVQESFRVIPEHSGDKADDLGTNRVGYKSLHYVCTLGDGRQTLPEHRVFNGLRFEIQVRSVLQHAWAEIEHDRGYKFGGVLPPDLKRRLSLLAGQLESADREFDLLAAELDKRAERVAEQAEAGDLNDLSLDSSSLAAYVDQRRQRKTDLLGAVLPDERVTVDATHQVIEELSEFGITTLAELDRLLQNPALRQAYQAPADRITLLGLVRSAMVLSDVEKYFASVWRGRYVAVPPATLAAWRTKYSPDALCRAIEDAAGVRVDKKPDGWFLHKR